MYVNKRRRYQRLSVRAEVGDRAEPRVLFSDEGKETILALSASS